MNTLSIAELIGWEPAHDAMPGATWKTPDGWVAGPPTVDHLLTWLRDRQAFVALVAIVNGEVAVEYRHPEGFYTHAKAMTVLGALEQAVRTVATGATP